MIPPPKLLVFQLGQNKNNPNNILVHEQESNNSRIPLDLFPKEWVDGVEGEKSPAHLCRAMLANRILDRESLLSGNKQPIKEEGCFLRLRF